MRVDDPVSANRAIFRPDRRRHIHSAPLLANLMRKYRIGLKRVLKIDDDIRGDHGDNCKIEIFKEDCLPLLCSCLRQPEQELKEFFLIGFKFYKTRRIKPKDINKCHIAEFSRENEV